jgi:putative membrane protein
MNQTLAKVLYVAGVTTFCTFLGCWAVLAHQENTPVTQKQATHRANAGGDEKFMRDAAEGSVSEIDLGKLAQEKGQSEQVKQFGKRMVEDHTKANEELKQIADREHINLPTNVYTKDANTHRRLQKMTGAEFDKAYAETMVQDHQEDIAKFKQEASSGQKSSLQQYAQQTLPTLESHLKEAQQLRATISHEGAKKRSGASSGASHR